MEKGTNVLALLGRFTGRTRSAAAGAALALVALLPAGNAGAVPSATHVAIGEGAIYGGGLTFSLLAAQPPSGPVGTVTIAGDATFEFSLTCLAFVVEGFPVGHKLYGSGPAFTGGTYYVYARDGGVTDEFGVYFSPADGASAGCDAPDTDPSPVIGNIVIAP